MPWYAEAIDAAQQTAVSFQNLVKSRRTVHKFDATEVDDGVLRRALECAIAAPNRRGTEVSETLRERDFEYILCPTIPFYIHSHSISNH